MLKTYENYLKTRGLCLKKINFIINNFINFVNTLKKDLSQIKKEDIYVYSKGLIKEHLNSVENFEALRDYMDFSHYQQLYVTFIEILDGWNVIEVLLNKIKKLYGEKLIKEIFLEELPQLGITEIEKVHYTKKILERMSKNIPINENIKIWFNIQHGLLDQVFQDENDRELFLKCHNFDDFLYKKKHKRDELLTELKDQKKLWYTLEINDDVLDFVKKDQEIEVGKREGNLFYITKIPYNPIRYLSEKNEKLKRYYACHCPWVRELILTDEKISIEICNCSVGHASHYISGALNQKIQGKVIESVLKGDLRCRFVFELPKDIK